MATPTTHLPTFATDELITSGADTGLSVRLEPSDPVKAQGHQANSRVAARIQNWLQGAVGDWLTHLASVPMRTWRREVTDLRVGSDKSPVLGACFAHTGAGWLIGLGVEGYGFILGYPAPTPDSGIISGNNLEPLVCKAVVTASRAPNNNYAIVGITAHDSATDTKVWFCDARGNAFSSTISGAVHDASKVVSTSAGFMAFSATVDSWCYGGLFWRKVGTGEWEYRSIDHTESVGGTRTISHVVANPSDEICIGFCDSGYVVFTTDLGTSWRSTQIPSNEAAIGIAWTAEGWVVLDEAGKLYRKSADDFWTLLWSADAVDFFQFAGVATDSVRYYGNQLASDGGAGLVSPLVDAQKGYGVRYSIDGGLTWTRNWLGVSWSVSYPPLMSYGVSYANGEYLLPVLVENTALAGRGVEIWRSARI
jgi:hypothetical protein